MPEKIIYNFSNEPTGTHMLLINEISDGSKILDVGCASGYLGEYLINEKKCEVWGIEPDVLSYNQALDKGYKKIINKGVESALNDIVGEKFDFILAGDMFEHLVAPETILLKLKDYLSDGKIALSLPNVAHYSIRCKLLFGKWDMQKTGILDSTHLHFYTLKTAKELLKESGWKIERVRPRGDLERWFRKIGMERIGKLILFFWPEFFAIQFIFIVKVK